MSSKEQTKSVTDGGQGESDGSGPLIRDGQRILVVRLSAIGDCLHAVPVVEELRRRLPAAEIGWLVQPVGHRLLGDHPAVDRFHLFHRSKKGLDALGEIRRLRAELREANYDVAIDLQGLTKSGLLARLSGATVYGFDEPESKELNAWFVKHRVGVAASVEHVVDRNLELLRLLGVSGSFVNEVDLNERGLNERAAPTWNLPVVDLGETEIGSLLDSLPAGARPAVINPGTTWPTKIWADRRFAEVAFELACEGLPVVVTWAGAEEEAMADAITARVGELAAAAGVAEPEKMAAVVKAPPTSLMELRGLLQRASVVVANDSGPLHLAVAVGVPAVGVYGPTDPERNGPYGFGREGWPSAAVTLVDEPPRQFDNQRIGGGRRLDCQYCWKTRCLRGDNACLEQLESLTVLEATRALLAGS